MSLEHDITLNNQGDLTIRFHRGRQDQWVTLGSWKHQLNLSCSRSHPSGGFEHPTRLEVFLESATTLLMEDTHPAVVQWREQIPLEFRNIACHFPGFILSLLRLAAQYPQARQWLIADSVLLWLVLSYQRQHSQVKHIFPQVFFEKRTVIMKKLGFLGRKCEHQLLNKLAIETYDQPVYDLLNRWLNSEYLPQLMHYPTLMVNQLSLLDACPELLGAKFSFNQRALLDSSATVKLTDTLKDCLRMCRQLQQWPQRQVQFMSIERLDRFDVIHAELVEELLLFNQNTEEKNYYPQAPLSGTETIVPIKDSLGLYREGQKQNHCVYSYHEDILNGTYFVYQILFPQRATLGLQWVNKKWQIDQLYAHSNQDVNPATQKAVEQWFKQQTELQLSVSKEKCSSVTPLFMETWKENRMDELYSMYDAYQRMNFLN